MKNKNFTFPNYFMDSMAYRSMRLERSANIERLFSPYSMAPSLIVALDKQIIFLIIILQSLFFLDGTYIYFVGKIRYLVP